ncbi:MAG TPA: RICIN domain-containing protein [Lachnospiraceae bacterium]|nr:RICIN domain-containing protein [Lachnospiraceae bacterium]
MKNKLMAFVLTAAMLASGFTGVTAFAGTSSTASAAVSSASATEEASLTGSDSAGTAAAATQETSFTDGNFIFTKTSDSEASLSGLSESFTGTDLTVPATASDGTAYYSVTSVAAGALSKSGVKTLTISASVKSFGGQDLPDLTSVSAADGNTDFIVKSGVLFSVNGSESTLVLYPAALEADLYVIPAGTSSVAAMAFSSVKNLKTVVIPDGLNTIEEKAFNSFVNPLAVAFSTVNAPASVADKAFYLDKAKGNVFYFENSDVLSKIEKTAPAFAYSPAMYDENGVLTADSSSVISYVTDGIPADIKSAADAVYNVAAAASVEPEGTAALVGTADTAGADAKIAKGCYRISSALSSSVSVNISAASVNESANAEINTSDDRDGEIFYVIPTDAAAGKYEIQAYCSGKALSISDSNPSNWDNICQKSYTGADSQQWYIRVSGQDSKYVSIVSVADQSFVFDVLAGSAAAGTNLQLYSSNASKAQRFAFSVVADPASTGVSGGLYTIESGLDQNLVLDVSGGYAYNGQNIQIYSSNGSIAQKFYVVPVGYGNLYRILNAGSEKSVDVSGGSTASGANVQQYTQNGSPAQLFRITQYADGTYKIIGSGSGNALDVYAGIAMSGENVQMWSPNGSSAQKWVFASQSALPVRTGTEVSILSKGNINLCLDVDNYSTSNFANVQLYYENGQGCQRFVFTDVGGGYYTIQCAGTGKYLDVLGGSKASGANIQQYVGNNSDAQKWKPVDTGDGDGSYYFFNKASGMVLDIYAAIFKPHSNIQQWTSNLSTAQKFYITTPVYASGWQLSNGSNYRYYVWPGVVLTNAFVDNGNYYCDSNGDAVTGWEKYGSYYYYYRGLEGRANDSRPYLMDLFGTKQSKTRGEACPNCSYYVTVDRIEPSTVTVYTKYPGTSDWNLPVFACLCSPGATYDNRQTDAGDRRIVTASRWQELMGPSYGQYASCALISNAAAGYSGTGWQNCGEYFHSVACGSANDHNLDPGTYNLLGTRQSHGCIRLAVRNAYWIYEFVTEYTHLYVGDNLAEPVSHIPQPYMVEGQCVDPTDPAYTGNYGYTDSGNYYQAVGGFQ